jgi:signal transduction histidine kinase
MSLFRQTARYLLGVALVIALVGAVGFHTLIHRKIRHEVDEILLSQAKQATSQLHRKEQPAVADGDDNPHIEPVNQVIAPTFSDVMVPDSQAGNELIVARQFQTTVPMNGQLLLVRVRQPYYEFNELARDLSFGVIIGFLLLMALSVLIGLGLSRQLWRPFYVTIGQLGKFRLDSPESSVFPQERIREFALLNRSLSELVAKLRQQFSLQKQFTENASHELQTPLAIATAELDFLFQSPQLTETDHTHLQRASDALNRLSQLNRSLLLLTQVENDQFASDERLDVSALLVHHILDFAPFFIHKELAVDQSISPGVIICMNRQLAGVLVTNLLKNTARHCPVGGHVGISLMATTLSIRNTGVPLPFAENQLFDRFVKDPARPDSIGLGLALVRQICDRYGLVLTYEYDASRKEHVFQIEFSKQAV